MSQPKPARYCTTNRSAYNAALHKRASLLIWPDEEMVWHASHEGCPRRPSVLVKAAMQCCLSIEVLSKLPLKKTARLLRLAGLDWAFPDYSTRCWGKKTLTVQIPYRRAKAPTGC